MEQTLIILTTTTFSRAQLLKSRLEYEGIDCFLTNVNVIKSTIPYGVKVRIRQEDSEAALKILSEVEREYGEEKIPNDETEYTIKSILVPIDFSDYSFNACRYAIGFARKLNAGINILHIYYFPVMISESYPESFTYQINLDITLRDIAVNAEKSMEKFHNKVAGYMEKKQIDNVEVSSEIRNGIPSESIEYYAKEYKSDMIIMGNKGFGKKEGFWLGSVATDIIEDAKQPVLVIPEVSKYTGIENLRIMYATNFDDSDFKAIRKLMSIVHQFNTKIYFVHIGNPKRNKWNKTKMSAIARHFNNEYRGYNMESHIIESKDMLSAIDNFIQTKNINMISLTTHKRGVINKLLHSSFTKKILFHTNTPLLVFHS